MANNQVSDLRESLETWHAGRIEAADKQIREDAERLKTNIIKELTASHDGKTANSSELSAKTTMSAEAKAEQLAPSSKLKKSKTTPQSSLNLYIESIIIDDESSGTNVVHVVKLDDMKKKDGTTGMSLDKIAKAVEFGTSSSAPRPAWRRSLKRLELTGAYRKKQ